MTRISKRPAVLALAAVAAAGVSAAPQAGAATTPVPAIRLVAAPTAVVDETGAVWSPDARFADGGTVWQSTSPIAGTTNDKVFQPERWGVRGYAVPVPASGDYVVTVNAAEVVFTTIGKRVFSITAEGRPVVTNLDLVKSVGAATASSSTFTVTVTDGVLDLGLTASVNSTKVSSLQITPVTPAAVVARVVAGGAPVTDESGAVWAPDTRLAVGGNTWTSASPIAGTTDDRVFQAERWAVRGYEIPVPAVGAYTVTLNEAELAFTTAGQRVFGVEAEGAKVLSDIDIAKAVGPKAAQVLTFTVDVVDGVLSLGFPTTVNYARVSSLLVAAAGPAATPVQPPATSLFGAPLTGDPRAPRGGGFGAASVWLTDVHSAPLATNSAALVSNLDAQVKSLYGGNAAFNVWQYNGNFYTVPGDQARVDVKWNDCQGKGSVPTGLLGPGGQFMSVPIPSNAAGSTGTDSSISIYQPGTDTMWDFWKLAEGADGWHACWGGRIDHVSTSQGWFLNGFGATATGLAGEGGMVNIRDVEAGSIDHALSLAVLRAAPANTFSWPAQRSDGSDTAADAIPEGTRLRLDPTVDVASLTIHPIAKMIAKAAQTYGFIVTDRAGTVGVAAEGGSAVQLMTGVNPWSGFMAGTPSYGIMAGFPWNRLQALPKDYGKP